MNTGCIQALPNELLTEIFQWSLPDAALLESTEGSPLPFSLFDAPLSLQTCQNWRQVAIATQCLWASLYVHISEDGRLAPPLDVIEIWLKRSKRHPVFVGFSVHYNVNVQDVYDDIDRVLALLIQHISRWKCLHLYMPYCRMPNALKLEKSDIDASRLTTLDTDIADLDSDMLKNILGIIKQPNRVRFYSYLETDTALEWFGSCTNLIHCEIQSVRTCKYASEPVTCPKLQGLTIHQADDDFDEFLENLIAPSLQYLDITCTNSYSKLSFERGLGRLIERSECSLQWLILDTTQLSQDDLIDLLETVPTLLQLELVSNTEPCVGDQVLVRLAERKLCPRVLRIMFGASVLKCSDGLVGRMVQNRRPLTFPSGEDVSSPEDYHIQCLELGFEPSWLDNRPKDRAILELMTVGGFEVILAGISYKEILEGNFSESVFEEC